jgi:hypothetical protein
VLIARAVVVAVLVVALAGCTDDGPDASPQPTAGASTTAPLDATASCSPMPWNRSVIEGRSDDDQSVFGLLEAGPRDLAGPEAVRVGRSVKLSVRITGSGDLEVAVTGPGGAARGLDWGPEPHSGSSFDHPGDEWGIGFTLDQPGCWTVAFTRTGEGTGYVQLAAA